MVDTAPGAASASLRRDAILQAVADAAERLLLAADWRFAADDVLARLGVGRGGLPRLRDREPRRPRRRDAAARSPCEWCAPGIDSQVGNAVPDRGYDWDDGFGRFAELHRRRRGRDGRRRATSCPRKRPELERQGIVSLVELPVMVEGAWWGAVGFDDCRAVRDWTGAEIDALRPPQRCSAPRSGDSTRTRTSAAASTAIASSWNDSLASPTPTRCPRKAVRPSRGS